MADQVIRNVRQFVQIKGEATYDSTGRIASIYVRDMEAIEELSDVGSTLLPISSFWKGKSFDELATVQGIYPLEDPSKLSKDWPEDADFDKFLDAVRSSRN